MTENEDKDTIIEQYSILNARRDSFNNLLWQTPVISLTAQAFLFTISLGKDVTPVARLIACGLAFITAIASTLLLNKHRFMEKKHALMLEEIEKNQNWIQINRKLTSKTSIQGISGYQVWLVVFIAFAICSFLIPIFAYFGLV